MSSVSYLALAAMLFCIGLYGVITKRNAVIVLFSIELMLNAVNINFITFAKFGLNPSVVGHVFSLFVITIAAAEAAVGIAILIAIYRNKGTVESSQYNTMKN